MELSLHKEADHSTLCLLCHRERLNDTTLGCGHAFCKSCLWELWSELSSGPYYCPECNYLILDLSDTEIPSTSRGPNTEADHSTLCLLCHRERLNDTTLGCGHAFCKSCLRELWSELSSGPYYCPECNYLILDLSDTEIPSTSRGPKTEADHSTLCLLCHRERLNDTTLGCGHAFCKSCLRELWRELSSGPYYCPECKYQILDLSDTEIPSTSRGPNTEADHTTLCLLCHRERLNQMTLGCGHAFCKSCLRELWRELSSGPYYCPECNYLILEQLDLSDTEIPSTSRGPNTDWNFGNRLSSHYSSQNLLGKRKFSSGSFSQNSRGHTQGTVSNKSNPITVSDTSDDGTPAKKKATREKPSSDTSSPKSKPSASQENTASSTESHPATPNEPSRSDINMSEPQPASSTNHTEPAPKTGGSSSSPEKQTRAPSSTKSSSEGSSASSSVLCNYCSSRDQRPAVKTCLVCGASMCPEHLRVHLESPVFQSHPLVDAVDDVSPWRCQEHQEMTRIYCRDCSLCVCTVCTVIGSHKEHACISINEAEKELRATLKSELKKIQTTELAVLDKVNKFTEKKCSIQENLERVRAGVVQQYQTMREALQLEEQQALLCVAQEQNRVLGSIDSQLGTLNQALTTIQTTFHPLAKLADAQGASRAQGQAFIMEYRKITAGLNGMADPMEMLGSVEEVNQGRLDCLHDWTERRLDDVIISMPHRDPFRLLYGLNPTLDPDTAHPKLLLSAENRRVEYVETQQSYPDLEARFNIFPQVLGSTALTQGRHYWEVAVSVDEGRWKVGVSDGNIGRKGQKDSCRLGFYSNSWCLIYEKGKVEALHNKETSPVCVTQVHKVGVLLDFEEGSLSFFSVGEGDTLTMIYSFQHAFSEPLYPALAVSKTQLCFCDVYARPSAD